MPSWIIAVVIIVAAVAADIIYLVRRKKSGKCSCGGCDPCEHDCSKCGCCCGHNTDKTTGRGRAAENSASHIVFTEH